MLQAADITKKYRGKTVLSDVGFTLAPGECLGVAGHNGSGKSTLLSIVAQVTRCTAGTLTCDGENVLGNRAFLRRQLGYVPQYTGLLGDLTVDETLRFWQKSYGMPAGDVFAQGSPASLLGLQPLGKKRVSALSGGMQKRLSLTIAIMHSPRFVLLDEVLSSLDRSYRAALLGWLEAARSRGGSILYCSHEVEELKSFCDNILVLQNGRTVFYGPAAAFPTDTMVLDAIMNPA